MNAKNLGAGLALFGMSLIFGGHAVFQIAKAFRGVQSNSQSKSQKHSD